MVADFVLKRTGRIIGVERQLAALDFPHDIHVCGDREDRERPALSFK
jgi:hypothetical protein